MSNIQVKTEKIRREEFEIEKRQSNRERDKEKEIKEEGTKIQI